MRSIPVFGVTSAEYLDSFCQANFRAKNKSSFYWVFCLAYARITPSIWSTMSLYTAITWCNLTVCLFDIHRVQYQNGLNPSMIYFTMVHSSCVIKSGQFSLYVGFWRHLHVNPHNWEACLSNSSVEFQCFFTSIIRSTEMRTLAFWQSMNSFRRPDVRVINTASILCYIKVNFRTF